jgi:hypothetical protein
MNDAEIFLKLPILLPSVSVPKKPYSVSEMSCIYISSLLNPNSIDQNVNFKIGMCKFWDKVKECELNYFFTLRDHTSLLYLKSG